MQQVVLPIKDSNVLKEVQDTLLNNFKAGRRNYTVFQVGKATLQATFNRALTPRTPSKLSQLNRFFTRR
ncbi:hypothetical protein [Latilactobacillus sakei]|uniref:hypothetical protein n=1 Tax=Latilactobacillus sakei TaxID=1599 RepID=UPI001F4C37A9|nr:hypothetical protein [Latilactobacillus sakei]UNC24113.1 hypothetical protein FX989_09890 [Latilactobacillus sakei]